MKIQIDTAPVWEAFSAPDECPFCYLERQAQEKALRYVAGPGATYMEPDVRGLTNEQGFCREHMKALYHYGNSLGNGLMLQTYLQAVRQELHSQLAALEIPEKKGLFAKKQEKCLPIVQWGQNRTGSCFVCSKISYNMKRYYVTFFHLIKDMEFRRSVEQGKGFCLDHFTKLLELAEEHLPNGQREWFYTELPRVMEENLARVQEDIDWFVEKFDYRNAAAPWKNAQDAVPRTMEKLRGGHPGDKPLKED